jgi:branched-chain amino acid transport system ATP-binding protein
VSETRTETASVLTVANLSAGYGRSQVLFDMSFEIPRTGGVAVLGRNGAGKTTLLKTLAGDLPVMGGEIVFSGMSMVGEGTESRVRRGLGYVPQEQAVFGSLSVRENLMLGTLATPERGGYEMALDFFPKLGARLSQKAGTLSGGERKMLAIARALLGRPRLLMLDEPTEGVWIGVIEEIADRLSQLVREIAVVIVEQHVELALRVSERAIVMDRGQIALAGPAAEIAEDPRLPRYLAP